MIELATPIINTNNVSISNKLIAFVLFSHEKNFFLIISTPLVQYQQYNFAACHFINGLHLKKQA